jgi:Ni/Co efflux regulator RcnB
MSIRLLIAVAAVVAVPMAVSGQEPARKTKPTAERRYCQSYTDIQSRLQNRRRCQTRAERDAMKQDARQAVERIQSLKVSH